jgi:hypothetical protein
MSIIYVQVLTCLLQWLSPNPSNVRRLSELATIASDIAHTDATIDEALELAAIAVHESRAHLHAIGDGGRSHGPFQIQGGPPTAREALLRLRWSQQRCGVGDLSLYAGFGRCGVRPDVSASLLDPTIARR